MRKYLNASNSETSLSRRRAIAVTSTLGLGLVAGCTSSGGNADDDATTTTANSSSEGSDDEPATTDEAAEAGSWRTVELTDVLTDEPFTIDGLAGPIAIQSFAVWCPKCQRQSQKLSNVDESVTLVSINIDPNEDAEKVKQHATDNGFDWRFAVAPTAMTESLIKEFGTTVTNAPSTPIIVACDDGVAEFFSGSQQSAEQIESAASNC